MATKIEKLDFINKESEIDPHICAQLIFDKNVKTIQ